MCGIFGYVGRSNQAPSFVLEGLKRLEYRGYDSWGIAVKAGQQLLLEKHVGKIGGAHTLLPASHLGIGHTRWATHGGVTDENAHPHLDCTKTVAVVHNGIIDNFQELKDMLVKKGHKFVSETDTEVIPHLIEEYLKIEGFASSVRDAFNRLEGLNAIVTAYAPSTEIIAAKTGSPLIVGIGPSGLFVASDAIGILPHTKKIIFLDDHQMVILGKRVKVISLPVGHEITPKVQTVDWKFEEAEKGVFRHFLEKEIFEQPRIITHIATNLDDSIETLARRVQDAFGTFFVGCGSAAHTALAGTYLFSRIAKKHVNFATGSEFCYLEDYLTPRSLVIAMSQSGETIDVINPVNKAQEKGAHVTAIVNVLGSTLYRLADEKILLGVGTERAVIATKSVIAMLAVLLLVVYSIVDELPVGKKLLQQAAADVSRVLRKNNLAKLRALTKKLKKYEHIYLLGRGLSSVVALEAALKIKETSYVHAEGFAGGDLKHGVIALIEKGTPCIFFAPNDETYVDIISNAQEVKARGGYIIGVGPKNNQVFDDWIETADLKEATMLPQVVIAQLLSYYLALERGIEDPDKPRNLAKSVTVK